LIAVRAGEGAAAVAEQLALEEVTRDRGAVEGDEGPLSAVREFVNSPGQDLLAGAALARDQDIDLGPRDAPRLIHQLAHLSGNHRALVVRQFLDWPKSSLSFTLGSCLSEVVDRIEKKSHGANACNRLYVVLRDQS
jgi:hypothetical protein